MNEPVLYSAQHLSEILGVSVQAIHKRALKEGWNYEEVPNSKGGGSCKKFTFDSLPGALQLALRASEAEQLAEAAAADPIAKALIATDKRLAQKKSGVPAVKSTSTVDTATGEGLSKEEKDRALLVSRLVFEYRGSYAGKTNGAVLKAKKDFVEVYNQGQEFPSIYTYIGKTSFQTMERWDLQLRRNANRPFILADLRGKHRKGQTSITPAQERIIEIYAYHPNRFPDSEIIRNAVKHMKIEGIPCTQSEDTFRRHLDRLRSDNFADWIFRREGWKALNEKCLFHVSRDYDAIEVGDIVFADGHVLNFEILNPWTGRPKRMTLLLFYDMKSNMPLGWEIMPTENTQAIKVALYRSILRLGKIPRVVYLDNGRAFRGQYFTGTKDFREIPEVGLFNTLGMKSIFAWPYHAETKPIEGFFHLFAELERSAPSYSGTSINDKPARMKRGEVLHRKLYECLTRGAVPTMIDAHLAIAHWIDTEYSVRPQDGHLKGRCPLEVFAEGMGPGLSEEEAVRLRLLMDERHLKKIPRDGIRMPWSEKLYYHPTLFGRQNQPGIVRYDWQDKRAVYVYDADGKFVCEARQVEKVHPAAKHLGTAEDVAELERQLEMKASLAKTVTGKAREFIEAHVVPEVRREIEDIASMKESVCEAATGAGLKGAENSLQETLSPEEAAWAQREFEEMLAAEPSCEISQFQPEPEFCPDRARLLTMTDMDRYETLLEWTARGVDVGMEDKRWMGMYERTEEYDQFRGYYEDTELRFQLLYGVK